jgi:hypothetical protein
MLEMQIVLRTALAARDLRQAGDGFELARRRNITIRPGEGARAVLGDRQPTKIPAAA